MRRLILKALDFPKLPAWVRYPLATLIVGLALGVRLLLIGLIPGYPFLLFFPAVILVSLLLDFGSARYAALLSAACATYLFIEPAKSFSVATLGDVLALILFLILVYGMAVIIETMRHAVAQSRAAEAEKDLLLSELNHRIKNDLQAIAALLTLQSVQVPHPQTREALLDAAQRVGVLGRVHARLGHQDRADTIDMREFLERLCDDLRVALIGPRPVALALSAESVQLPPDRAVHLGLIVNELLTNSLKYAFPDGQGGRIEVILAREEDSIVLEVRDDGVGPPPERSEITGFGIALVRALVEQLGGTLTLQEGPGMRYRVLIR